jgi:hypothetical protein
MASEILKPQALNRCHEWFLLDAVVKGTDSKWPQRRHVNGTGPPTSDPRSVPPISKYGVDRITPRVRTKFHISTLARQMILNALRRFQLSAMSRPRSLPRQSVNAPPRNLSSIFAFWPDPRGFPRNFVSIDGAVVRLSIPTLGETRTGYQTLHTLTIGLACIPSFGEAIPSCCFHSCRDLAAVVFEADCRVTRFGESAFVLCSSLQSICIPSSIETISESSFGQCDSLSLVTFERGSKLSKIGETAFLFCSSLQSICLPASIEVISKACFSACTKLWNVRFETDCRLSHLAVWVFHNCSSLRSIRLPPSIRTVSPDCFSECQNLVDIVVESDRNLSEESLSNLRSKYPVTIATEAGSPGRAGEEAPLVQSACILL